MSAVAKPRNCSAMSTVCGVCGDDNGSDLVSIFDHDQKLAQQAHRCLPVLIREDERELSTSICVTCVSSLAEVNAFFDLCEQGLQKQIDAIRALKPSLLDRQTHLDQYRRSFRMPVVPRIKLEMSDEFNDENEEPLNILYDEPYVGHQDPFLDDLHDHKEQNQKPKKKRKRNSKSSEINKMDVDENLESSWLQEEQHSGSEKDYKCQVDECDLNAKVVEVAQKPKRRKKETQNLVPCPVCKKLYPPGYLHSRHMLVHSATKAFECGECKKAFKTQADLKVHSKVHLPHDERYTHCCEVCGKRFTQKANLEAHLRFHKGLKPYQCDICGNYFSQKGNLEEHRRIHTGEKPFVCETCGSAFARRSELHLHKRCAHTGERPFQCAYCPKSFQRRDLLRKHERIHTDTRPYKCKFCSKAFTQRDKLVVHTRLHTGERPYVCEVCGKGFCESGNLKKHLRVHGKQAPSVLHQNNKGKPAPGSVLVKMDEDEGKRVANEESKMPVESSEMPSQSTITTSSAPTTISTTTSSELVSSMLESDTDRGSAAIRPELVRPQNLTQYVVHPFVQHLQGIKDIYGQGN